MDNNNTKKYICITKKIVRSKLQDQLLKEMLKFNNAHNRKIYISNENIKNKP